MTEHKKLIEVALPLDVINKASIREKSIRHGHPSTLHLWWSRKPLATCRAVLFASLVDDPSSHPDEFPTEQAQNQERERLFTLIEALVQWENSNNTEVLAQVISEILKSTGGNPPPVFDPFAGGGSIPLEAQRLGLEAHASDLNPVAVLINKALIEIPPKFANRPPVNPDASQSLMGRDWHGAQGLADDIRYYGKWMRDEAEQRIGYLYPKVTLPKEYGGSEATVIAWLWVRTVGCPNPACGAQMPLTSKWSLSTKKGKEVWAEPVVNDNTTPPVIHFIVHPVKGKQIDGTVNRQGARCIACGTSVAFEHIRSEGKAGKMKAQLMAIVAEGQGRRLYLTPDEAHTMVAIQAKSEWRPEAALPNNPRDFKTPNYGMYTFGDLFTSRQLVALTTLSDLVQKARTRVLSDAKIAGLSIDGLSLSDDSTGANAYADAVATYLGLSVSRSANTLCSLALWSQSRDQSVNVFSRQAVQMNWDYPEVNPFAGAAGDFAETSEAMSKVVAAIPTTRSASIKQQNATILNFPLDRVIISTDPPYYDNIGYADLSDFFYVWLRCSLHNIYPDLFRTMLVPKVQELVATPYRFGGDRKKAQEFFELGLGKAFDRMRAMQHPDYPLTVYYAFKQAESETEDAEKNKEGFNGNSNIVTASTGWETMLEGLIRAGFTITGTWPMRTERPTGVKVAMNALASSIVLVCRPRPVDAPVASRRQFLNALRVELPVALKNLQHGNIAPVDLAQASIGPGMAIYSRYSNVVESDGTPLRVRTALQLINRTLDEILMEQEGEYDGETRWAIAWFEQFGVNAGEYGMAETLSKAKDTSLHGLVEAGLLEAKAGKVRLRKREELALDWQPKTGQHLTVWEVMQHMIHALTDGGKGELGAGDILRQVGEKAEAARDLAYRLYTVCERKGWAQEALAYNSLVTSWSEISRLALRQASDAGLWEAANLR